MLKILLSFPTDFTRGSAVGGRVEVLAGSASSKEVSMRLMVMLGLRGEVGGGTLLEGKVSGS